MNILTVHDLPTIEAQAVGVDIETTSTPGNDISNPWQDRIVSISVSDGETAWVMPPGSNHRSIVSLLNNSGIKKIIHNAVFDLSFLVQQLEAEPINIYDTMLISRLIYAGKDMKHGLEDCLAYELGVALDKSTRKEFLQHSGDMTREQIEYAAKDVLYLNKLREAQIPKVSSVGMGKVARLENEVVLAFSDMFQTGVRFDPDLWGTLRPPVLAEIERLKSEIIDEAHLELQPPDFWGSKKSVMNLNSDPQKKAMLKNLGYEFPNLQKATLETYCERHPEDKLIPLLLEYKDWTKISSWHYQDFVNPVTGRLHASWNQLVSTGRTSCSNPNLQQVPTPRPDKPNLRHLFLPPSEDYQFIIADYGQQEMKVYAAVCGDRKLFEACQSGDIYSKMGEYVYGKPLSKSDPERKTTKVVMLAMIYGARPKTLAGRLGTTIEKATKIRNDVLRAFPGMIAHEDKSLRELIQKGYTTTMLGRRKYFPEVAKLSPDSYWKMGTVSLNTPIQGTGADMLKAGLNHFRKWYKSSGSSARPALYIHDELVITAKKSEIEEVKYQLAGAMDLAASELCPSVPIHAELLISDRWDKT